MAKAQPGQILIPQSLCGNWVACHHLTFVSRSDILTPIWTVAIKVVAPGSAIPQRLHLSRKHARLPHVPRRDPVGPSAAMPIATGYPANRRGLAKLMLPKRHRDLKPEN